MVINISYELYQRLEDILFMISEMSTLKRRTSISEKKEEFCKLRDFLSSVKADSDKGHWFMNEIECFEHWFIMHRITEELKEKNRRLPRSIKILFDEIYDHLSADSDTWRLHLRYGDSDDY